MQQVLADMRAQSPEQLAIRSMVALMQQGHPLVIAYSGGKDSSVLANLALTAAIAAHCAGTLATLVLTHADVGAVENLEIRDLVR